MARAVKKELRIKNYELRICHLYSDLMDSYGDTGNIIAIQKRCEWREIQVAVDKVSAGDKLSDSYDFFFFGGGQDKAQEIVAKDLKKKGPVIKSAVKKGAVMLSICGGYQLLQKYFKTRSGEVIEGIGLFDAYTLGSDTRMIQNLLIKINSDLQSEIDMAYPKSEIRNPKSELVGFENHSGKTYLGENVKPLGTIIKGSGNNGKDKTEGAVYKNAFGCYLHGSLLPKNPHFADLLIAKALERKYGPVKLKPLDDTIEWQAHNSAIIRTKIDK